MPCGEPVQVIISPLQMNNHITALFVVILAIHHATAQTPKSKFDSKVKNLGVTFFTVPEIAKFTDCVDDSFYDLASMDKIKDKSFSCAMDTVPISKYGTLMNTKSTMDKCLSPIGQTTMKLIDKVMPAMKTALTKVYDKVIGDIKAAKNAGSAKQTVMNKGYTTATSVMTKPLIEQVCKMIVQKINKVEWNCFLTHAKTLVDFAQYECSKIVKN
ncbi:hypothetical protein ANCCAN_22455 [Ancylostoma caninum]|uniref:Uncharacterized protein n=1 Tax=Ancylostoma caninum TaxID=29170 RepID=A0A368FLR6_ANCCA|nr:hypothetical protein ANCCAN_22455 [Ancylostoma caninum]